MLKNSDLATIVTTPEGNLEVTLQRHGALLVRLPNGCVLHAAIKRNKKKEWVFALLTDADEKSASALWKENGGQRPSAAYLLDVGGEFRRLDAEDAKHFRAALNLPESETEKI